MPRAVRLTGSLSTGSHAKLPFHLGDRKNAMHGCAVIIPFIHSFISFDSRGHKMRGGSLSLGGGGVCLRGEHTTTQLIVGSYSIFRRKVIKTFKESKTPNFQSLTALQHSTTLSQSHVQMGPSSRKVRLPRGTGKIDL